MKDFWFISGLRMGVGYANAGSIGAEENRWKFKNLKGAPAEGMYVNKPLPQAQWI